MLKMRESQPAEYGETVARFALPAIILLGLALRIAYTASIYGPSLNLDYPGDYWDYHIAAKTNPGGRTPLSPIVSFCCAPRSIPWSSPRWMSIVRC